MWKFKWIISSCKNLWFQNMEVKDVAFKSGGLNAFH